jgi:hypothetical protein
MKRLWVGPLLESMLAIGAVLTAVVDASGPSGVQLLEGPPAAGTRSRNSCKLIGRVT